MANVIVFGVRYIEGIEVLYGTNTFHMVGRTTMLNLGRLLLPQRLGMITSAEMVWWVGGVSGGLVGGDRGKRLFTALLGSATKCLPNLRCLNISIMWDPLAGRPHVGEEAVRGIMDEIVLPVDGMVQGFGPQMRECRIGIYHRLWCALRDGGLWTGVKYERGELPSVADRYWRPLLPGAEGEGQRDGPEGYWISEGYDDSPPYRFAHINPLYDYDG